jgi:hypothetical protein
MNFSRYKPVGWRNESQRHSLSARGIKNKISERSYKVIGAQKERKVYAILFKNGDKNGISHISAYSEEEARAIFKETQEGTISSMEETLGAVGVKTHLEMTVTSAKKIVGDVKQKINAPFVNAYASTLGGEENVSVLILVSLDKKGDWENNILENSRYARFHLENDGTLEQFTLSRLGKKFRKTKVKDENDLIQKINNYIEEVR